MKASLDLVRLSGVSKLPPAASTQLGQKKALYAAFLGLPADADVRAPSSDLFQDTVGFPVACRPV